MNANALFIVAGMLVASLLSSCGSQGLNLSRMLQHVDPRTLEVHPDRYWSTDGSVYLSVVEEMDSCRVRYALIRTADDSVLSSIDSILVDPENFTSMDGMVVIDEFMNGCHDVPEEYHHSVSLFANSSTGEIFDRSSDLGWYIGSDGSNHYFRSQERSYSYAKRGWELSWDTVYAVNRTSHARTVYWARARSDTIAPIAIHEKFVVIGTKAREYSTPPYMKSEYFGIDFEYVESTSRDTLYLGEDYGYCDMRVVGRGYLLLPGSDIVIWVVDGSTEIFQLNKLLFEKGELTPERFETTLSEYEVHDDFDYYSTRDIRWHGDDRIVATVARMSGLHMHATAQYPLALFEIDLVDHSVRLLRMIDE